MIYIYLCRCGIEKEIKEKPFSSPSIQWCECGKLMKRKILSPQVINKPVKGRNPYGLPNPDWDGVHQFSEPTIDAFVETKKQDDYERKYGITFPEDS